ncbi:MAG TPA: PEP-CTERM sorting domain-containing protein [Lacipirellulaceae bacterium]|nr:PEP-CTERM sorting domain-containing protein [Lacipirellulaceae bacterium]
MKRCFAAASTLVALLALTPPVSAAVLYSQNFEAPITPSSTAATFGGFGQLNNVGNTGWQVQGGGGGGGISVVTGVDANGVGGSQALFANFDHSAATGFTFNQYTVYGAVGAAGASPASQVKVTMDLLISGSSTPNPLAIEVFGTSFTPVLANDAFTTVSYTLDQATGAFSGGASSNLRLVHGAGGFGFDANNIVRLDNVVIETIPEPAACGLLAVGAVAMMAARRRR